MAGYRFITWTWDFLVIAISQTLCLGQYREAFVDAAVDGAFLYDLNDDDLKNSLGKEQPHHTSCIAVSLIRSDGSYGHSHVCLSTT